MASAKVASRTYTVLGGGKLAREVALLGGDGIMKCYQCGTCTAICALSEYSSANFRKTIKYVQLGLQEKVLGDLTPWLCYYCGDCQASCPRNANPSEILAAVRRYQTGRYDWTGLSSRLQRSKMWELLSIAGLALFTVALVWFLHGPIVTSRVELETFAPIALLEPAGLMVFALLGGLLLINIGRMYRFVRNSAGDAGNPGFIQGLWAAFKQFVNVLPSYFLTQFPMSRCGTKRRWMEHMLIFSGYAASFLLFVVFLRYTLTNELYPITSPVLLVGFFSTLALLYGTSMSITRRLRKSDVYYASSRHSTDWMFLILLFFTALTGFIVTIFQYLSFPLATYITFTVHLAFVVPLLGLEVPFAKWSHLAYRPFAAYFASMSGMKVPMFRGKQVV